MSFKIHVGGGTIYLVGYSNLEIPAPNTFLAVQRPDLVKKYSTHEKQYYAKHKQYNELTAFKAGPKIQEMVCDAYGSFLEMPYKNGCADEILSRQVFEHFDITCATKILKECYRVLKHRGLLRIDIPDFVEALKQLQTTKFSVFY